MHSVVTTIAIKKVYVSKESLQNAITLFFCKIVQNATNFEEGLYTYGAYVPFLIIL